MNKDRALDWYARLPYPGKVMAASAQGARLRAWRYGPGSDSIVEQVLARDAWGADRWRSWQAGRLADVLRHSATQVPYYRRWFRRHPDRDPRVLAEWPVVDKAALRAEPVAFLAEDAPRRLYIDQTSGTSGSPLLVHSSRETLRSWFALCEARTRRWHGVSRHDRWAILGGQVVAPAGRPRPPYWVWNPALRQLYLSTHNVTPATVADYAAVLRRYQPSHVVAYPSAVAFLARLGLDAGEEAHGPRVVIGNAEPVLDAQRSAVAGFFGTELRETYGMAEMVGGAGECDQGTLHWWPDAGFAEVLDDDDVPVRDGGVGRLVLTGLVNAAMPLVRYEVGDRGRLPVTDTDCACGRALPAMAPVEGRAQDMIITVDGGRQFWMNPVFYGLPVAEAQVIQEQIDRIRVLIVPGDDFDEAASSVISARLRDRLGPVHIAVETCDRIVRGPSGKFRPVVSHLTTTAPAT